MRVCGVAGADRKTVNPSDIMRSESSPNTVAVHRISSGLPPRRPYNIALSIHHINHVLVSAAVAQDAGALRKIVEITVFQSENKVPLMHAMISSLLRVFAPLSFFFF